MWRIAAVLSLLSCASVHAAELETSSPESQGIRSDELVKLTRWIRDNPSFPVFSILISRNGKLVYELYTSSIDKDDAHYLMSVTKSVLSALVGIAIDKHLLRGSDTPVNELLPRALFASDADYSRFHALTLKQVLAMSAVDAPDPPRRRDAESVARYQKFWFAPNRLKVVLQQPLLKGGFQYNDSTPTIAGGALQYAVKESALQFAEETLFRPMGFRNYEWMHQDASGMDNAGYGLRLRPIDMQKLGLLYLNHGRWQDKHLVSKEWVDRSFQPWNRSAPEREQPDYGWFWWAYYYGPGWTAHVANGWKGQRIAVIPDQEIVITMTACIEDGSEKEFFDQLITKVVMPAVQHGADHKTDVKPGELAALLEQVHRGPARYSDFIEYRMVPSATQKQTRKPFTALSTQ